MDDYALVLNAGSSSLKFCVYRTAGSRRPGGWKRAARSRASARRRASRRRTAPARRWPTQALDAAAVRDGRAALDALAAWLRSHYGGARVLGVGHRVVHGGARFAGPTIVTPQVLERLRALMPLAPLHQPHNLAAIDAVTERLPGRAAGRLLRHELPSRPARGRRARAAARARSATPASSATASTACRTNTSPRCCRRSRRRSPTGA